MSPWWGRALTIAIAAICLAVTIWTGIGDSWTDAALTAPWMALLTLTCWATFWRPRVAVSDAGVELVNVSRTVFIPWPALHDIDTKWSLTLVTAYGRFRAWSAPAPGTRGALLSLGGSREEHGQPSRRGRSPSEVVRPGDLVDSPSGSAAALIQPAVGRGARGRSSRGAPVGARPGAGHVARGHGLAAAALLAAGIVTLV